MLSALPEYHEFDQQKTEMASWQPQRNSEIQRVTQKAIVSTVPCKACLRPTLSMNDV